jgi:hypothetical protein
MGTRLAIKYDIFFIVSPKVECSAIYINRYDRKIKILIPTQNSPSS